MPGPLFTWAGAYAGRMRAPQWSRQTWVVAVSVLAHGCLLAVLSLHSRVATRVLPPPGTQHGTVVSLVYLPASGAPRMTARALPVRKRAATGKADRPVPAPPAQTAPTTAENGVAGEASLGEGDVTVALMQFFPDPRPDLSRLPPGTQGDVVLQAVIGADGRIAQLTLKQGLGHGVDESVVATVEHWTFTPAMRDGKPVASEQELHFHYERA
jgi:periplasmic protein TonB